MREPGATVKVAGGVAVVGEQLPALVAAPLELELDPPPEPLDELVDPAPDPPPVLEVLDPAPDPLPPEPLPDPLFDPLDPLPEPLPDPLPEP
ncbi:MAG TPA: hypothetical protein VN894_07055, partial [Polyangiaceae bacterium]|nr:hypothetical protein [Polyangiaceae bacterium]